MASGIFTQRQVQRETIKGSWSNLKTPAVEYLVVGGGGGGGPGVNNAGGGGGGGGLLQGFIPVVVGSTITATVGGAGAANAGPGGDSSFSYIKAIGGGGGGTTTGLDGGSGGGGSGSYGGAGNGIGGQGYPGGIGTSVTYYGGVGGGGAGSMGQSAAISYGWGGEGGLGIASEISGIRTVYAGGGGGGARDAAGYTSSPSSGSIGGAGGGGNGGGAGNGGETAGATNTGGGGGGAGGGYSATVNGGSGIVIISYPDTYANATSQTNGTFSTSGSGSINFTATPNQALRTNTVAGMDMSTNNDFTLELFVNFSNLNATRVFLATGVTGADIQLGYDPTNGVYYNNGTTQSLYLSGGSSTTLVNNTWTHIVVVRSGTNHSLFSNGTRLATLSRSNSTTNFSDLYIGCYQGNPALYNPNGYMTNLRITNTAVYDPTASTLIVPTAPLTAISGTKLLLNGVSGSYLADSSTNSTVLTPYVTSVLPPTWNQNSPFATGLGYKNRVYTWTSSGTITF